MKKELELRYLKTLKIRLEKGGISKKEYKKELKWVKSFREENKG